MSWEQLWIARSLLLLWGPSHTWLSLSDNLLLCLLVSGLFLVPIMGTSLRLLMMRGSCPWLCMWTSFNLCLVIHYYVCSNPAPPFATSDDDLPASILQNTSKPSSLSTKVAERNQPGRLPVSAQSPSVCVDLPFSPRLLVLTLLFIYSVHLFSSFLKRLIWEPNIPPLDSWLMVVLWSLDEVLLNIFMR